MNTQKKLKRIIAKDLDRNAKAIFEAIAKAGAENKVFSVWQIFEEFIT